MKKIKTYLVITMAVFSILPSLLTSCVTSRKVNYMQQPDRHIPTYDDTLRFEDYTLREGDRLYIYIYSLDERISYMYNAGMTDQNLRADIERSGQRNAYDLYTYVVNQQGNINFPTIGEIYVKDKTTRQVKYILEEQLNKLMKEIPGYKTISAEVSIVQRYFSIIGMNSGRYPIHKEKMTIFEALAMAGDIDEFGDKTEIKLVRETNGITSIKTFDMRSKDIINSEFYYIEPNDILYIRRIGGYQFGINSATTAVSVVASTISFGVFIYSVVQTAIRLTEKAQGGN